jgi:hypothetical protein
MSYRALFIPLLASGLGLCVAVACSAGGGGPRGGGVGGAGATGGGGGNGGAGGIVNTGGAGGGVPEGGFDAPVGTGGQGGLGGGCATDRYDGEVVPLDMYLLLDKSGSMSSTDEDGGAVTRWDQVTGAIKEFLNLPGTNGLSVGLGFFPMKPSIPPPVNCTTGTDCWPYEQECLPIYNKCPSGWPVPTDTSCLPVDYHTPAVPISPLPGASAAVASAIDGASPNGNTPMAPALWGAMEYAQPWAQAHLDHVVVVVLATDGMPTDCASNEVSDVAAIAAGALQQAGIRTFVVGIGSQLNDLNQIASSGGTDDAFMVDTSSNVSTQFLDALNAIRGTVACAYKIPTPEAGKADPNTVNVGFTPDGGTQQVIPQVGAESACGTEPGWYYDDPLNPSQILLCPATCDLVQHTKGTVDVIIGCETIVK